MSPAEATALIQEIAQDSSKIFVTHHANVQIRKRDISRLDVERCLRNGFITEGPIENVAKQNWEATVEAQIAGEMVAVVAAIKENPDDRIIVVTAYVR